MLDYLYTKIIIIFAIGLDFFKHYDKDNVVVLPA